MTCFAQVPTEAMTFDFNVKKINMSRSQEEKIDKAIGIVRKIIATEEFRKRIINHTYNGKKTFVDNKGLTNDQIYKKILEGAEELQPKKNNTMDIEVELYYNFWTRTIGYTYPNTKRIWMNTKFFNRYTPVEVSDNLVHEWLHKLGFEHAQAYSRRRDFSVPYAIGYLIEELAAKIK
jgi:hypothetical protein